MTRIADLQDRLHRLAKRREDEGIYTDANLVEAASARIAELEAEVERLTKEIDHANTVKREAIAGWRDAEALSRTGSVKVKALDEDDYEEITNAAGIAMRRASRGIRGQVITVQDSFDWWVMKETERRILSALASPPAQAGAVTEAMVEAAHDAFHAFDKPGDWRGRMRTALTAALGAQTPPEGAVTEAQGWRDMASAPRDGSMVLVASNRVYPAVQPARWRGTDADASSFQYWDAWQHWFQDDDLLGWMPLPTPPLNQSEGADRG